MELLDFFVVSLAVEPMSPKQALSAVSMMVALTVGTFEVVCLS